MEAGASNELPAGCFCGYSGIMKSFVVLMLLLLLSPLARADGPDDQYIVIYNAIQQGDLLLEKGEPANALAKYHGGAKHAQKSFKTDNPEWVQQGRQNTGSVIRRRKLPELASKNPPASSSAPASVKPVSNVVVPKATVQTNQTAGATPAPSVKAPADIPAVTPGTG